MFTCRVPGENGERKVEDLNRFVTLTSNSYALFWDLTRNRTEPIAKTDLNRDAVSERIIAYAR
jgi:hypothetical protein